MNKHQALYAFWNSFNIPAYDETTVPDDAVMPYIAYNDYTDSIGQILPMSASIYYKTNSWQDISLKSDLIAQTIGEYYITPIDGGYMWITKGTPFAQRIANEDRDIRQVYINITVEFLTEV